MHETDHGDQAPNPDVSFPHKGSMVIIHDIDRIVSPDLGGVQIVYDADNFSPWLTEATLSTRTIHQDEGNKFVMTLATRVHGFNPTEVFDRLQARMSVTRSEEFISHPDDTLDGVFKLWTTNGLGLMAVLDRHTNELVISNEWAVEGSNRYGQQKRATIASHSVTPEEAKLHLADMAVVIAEIIGVATTPPRQDSLRRMYDIKLPFHAAQTAGEAAVGATANVTDSSKPRQDLDGAEIAAMFDELTTLLKDAAGESPDEQE